MISFYCVESLIYRITRNKKLNQSKSFDSLRSDSARPKSAPNSDFLEMHLELVYLAWIGIVSNSTILFVHISIHPKMGLITKDDLFGEIWVNFQLLQNPISEHTAV